jgi:hypothetical protein
MLPDIWLSVPELLTSIKGVPFLQGKARKLCKASEEREKGSSSK